MFIVFPKNYDELQYKEMAGYYTMKEGLVAWPCSDLDDAMRVAAALSAANGKTKYVVHELKAAAEVQAKQVTAKTVEYNERGEYFPGADINV